VALVDYRVTYVLEGRVEVIKAVSSYSDNGTWTIFIDGSGVKTQIRTAEIERIDRDDG
jgi:hypothetical protein